MKKVILLIVILTVSTVIAKPIYLFDTNSDKQIQKKFLSQCKSIQLDSINQYFIDNGYLDASVNMQGDTCFIQANSLYYLDKIIFKNSDTILTENIPFVRTSVNIFIDSVLQSCQSLGYQFANFFLDSTTVSDIKVTLYANIKMGPQTVIEKISYKGLSKTKSSLIDKYVRLNDSIMTSQTIQKLERDASSIPFVTYVPPIQQELNSGYTISRLIIPFKEKSNILFEGGGGYLSENDLFIWNLSLQFQNIFGGGQYLLFNSDKRDENNQNLSIDYSQPSFLLGVGTVHFGVQTRDYRNDFYDFQLQSGFETKYKSNLSFGLQAKYKSVELELSNNSYQLAEIQFSAGNLRTQSDYQNNHLKYLTTVSYGHRTYGADSSKTAGRNHSFNENRIEVQTEINQKIKNHLKILNSFHFRNLQTNENLPPLSELYLLGGPGSIRGFKNEQFASIRNLTFTLEPYLNFNQLHLFTFYDAGYLYNRVLSANSDYEESVIFRYGYGFGISYDDRLKLFKLSFGWNESLPFDNPYISLQLKTNL